MSKESLKSVFYSIYRCEKETEQCSAEVNVYQIEDENYFRRRRQQVGIEHPAVSGHSEKGKTTYEYTIKRFDMK